MGRWLEKLCFFSVAVFACGMQGTPNAQIPLETPLYLYKILSMTHWQATERGKALVLPAEDHDFIHLAREDQLEKIIHKYWSEVPQFVILKIEAAKLQGELVYEANEGKSTKYYHLYRGFIPFPAVVEAKIVYQHSSSSLPHREVMSLGDPVLRKSARKLSVSEILSPKIQNLIEEMKQIMRDAPGVGLAAPQIGESIQLIVVEDMDQSHLTKEQLSERDRHKVPFHVIINPQIYVEEEEKAEFFEGCLSVPEMMAVVPRAKAVRVECWNEKAEPIVIHAKGWYARILQHETDHLKGTLYIDRSLLPTLMTEENGMKLWKGKKIEEVKASLM